MLRNLVLALVPMLAVGVGALAVPAARAPAVPFNTVKQSVRGTVARAPKTQLAQNYSAYSYRGYYRNYYSYPGGYYYSGSHHYHSYPGGYYYSGSHHYHSYPGGYYYSGSHHYHSYPGGYYYR